MKKTPDLSNDAEWRAHVYTSLGEIKGILDGIDKRCHERRVGCEATFNTLFGLVREERNGRIAGQAEEAVERRYRAAAWRLVMKVVPLLLAGLLSILGIKGAEALLEPDPAIQGAPAAPAPPAPPQ